jgi:hypothetical protein
MTMGILDSVSEVVVSTINAAIAVFGPLFAAIIGDYSTNEFFFAKVLLFILLFVIVYVVLKKTPFFGDHKGVGIIIALVVSIFAVRFISENQLIQGILLPYGTLGVALTTLLPFLIFFYFIHESEMTGMGRRIVWVVFLVIFFVLWAYKADKLEDISNQIYVWTMVAVVAATVWDKQLHKYFGFRKTAKSVKRTKDKLKRKLRREIADLVDDYHRGIVDRDELERETADLKRRIEGLSS